MQLYRAIRTRTERRLSTIQPDRLNYSVLSRFIGGRDFSSIFQASWRSVYSAWILNHGIIVMYNVTV